MSPTLPGPNGAPLHSYTYPLSHASRQKPRKWPLVFRFIKGAIHHIIWLPVLLHALFTALIVHLDATLPNSLGLPSSIIPSLSIVVGLMLVFRNSSSYERYWGGRTELTKIVTALRNLTRSILVNGPPEGKERTVRVLIALMYSIKNYLRGRWGQVIQFEPEYAGMLPREITGHESVGLGLPVELLYLVESYIRDGARQGRFNAPQSSMLSGQLNAVMDAFGKMETIKLTPIPVCHQIHQKQVLALYCCVLPFCLVDELGWWSVPVIALVCFTLYGIEGIGEELEDPFGVDKNDIRIDAVIEDAKQEIMVLLNMWKKGQELWCEDLIDTSSVN